MCRSCDGAGLGRRAPVGLSRSCGSREAVQVRGSGEYGQGSGVGQLIRVRRRAAGLTQDDLACLAGVSVGALRDLEQGRTHRPRSRLITRLAEALGLAVGEVKELAREAVHTDARTALVGPGVPPTGLWLRILGPMEAWRDGTPLALGPPRQRVVLGLLALSAGTSVHRDTLIDAVWGD